MEPAPEPLVSPAVAVPVQALELAPFELLWVAERYGVRWWPYPFRRAYWPAEDEQQTLAARYGAERGLARRGLLVAGAPVGLLALVGKVFAGWTESVDLIYRAGFAGCACSDGVDAVLVTSRDVAGAPLRVRALDPARLAEAMLSVVPPCEPGAGEPRRVPARPELARGRGAGQTFTRRTAADLQAVSAIVDTASGHGQAGAVVRLGQRQVRSARLVVWVDGPRGRFSVRHEDYHGQRSAVLTPATAGELVSKLAQLLAEIRSSTNEGST